MTEGAPRPTTLTARDKAILSKRKITKRDRAVVPQLWEPFEATYQERVRPLDYRRHGVWAAFRLCAQAMLALDCAYWAFEWDPLLAWREEILAREAGRTTLWKQVWHQRWAEMTATLFFLGVLPYRETMYRQQYKDLGRKWLGPERATPLEDRFLEVARSIGYRHERQLRGRASACCSQSWRPQARPNSNS